MIFRTAKAFRFEQWARLSPRIRGAYSSPECKQSRAASTAVFTRVAKSNMAALEVEEKFSLAGRDLSELALALEKQGFELASETTIVDWYLDVTENSSYALLRRDCWLRCRQSRGQRTWQLKRGQSALGSSLLASRGRATVYEEIEGIEGLKTAFSLLATMNQTAGVSDVNSDEDFENSLQESIKNGGPAIRFSDWNLNPFAKVVSRRSSWKVTDAHKQTSPFCDLCVDVDVTDSGHAIGEVEAVVAGADEVFDAKMLITKLVDLIGGSPNVKAEGKLEYFLRKNRPDVYQICIDIGLL